MVSPGKRNGAQGPFHAVHRLFRWIERPGRGEVQESESDMEIQTVFLGPPEGGDVFSLRVGVSAFGVVDVEAGPASAK